MNVKKVGPKRSLASDKRNKLNSIGRLPFTNVIDKFHTCTVAESECFPEYANGQ